MPAPSDKPLRKVTLNLYEEDVAQLIARYGNGWTTEIRNIINERCRFLRLQHAAVLEIFENGN